MVYSVSTVIQITRTQWIHCITIPPSFAQAVHGPCVSFCCICCHVTGQCQGGNALAPYYLIQTRAPILDALLSSRWDVINKVMFNVGTTSKVSTHQHSMMALIGKLASTPWSCVVFGYERSTYVATAVHDFLAIILGPWQVLIDKAPESFLWLFSCGALVNNAESFANLRVSVAHHGVSAAIAFNAVQFQPSFSMKLLLAFFFTIDLSSFVHEQEFQSNKDSPSHVVKKSKAIQKAQRDHPGVTLPSPLKKISDKEAEPDVEDDPDVTPEEREAVARPKTAQFYKKECNE
ncbi:hypothetical protein P692DRAFT_20821254 [Suillus brevipes Sb2]|nr:hypothetical protein P692DRAFT_20821254 [Suillus brevipes Sb2]